MTLHDKLDAQRDRSAANPVWRATYEATVAELGRSGFLDMALRAGARFPDFLLPSAADRLVSLSDLLARGPLAVTFIRGQWCPYCNLTLAALEESLPDIRATGGQLVAITPETGGRALAVTQQHNLHYDVLVDVDSGVGLNCGVVFHVPEPYRSAIARAGIDLADRQGNGGGLLPVPAVYVIDRTGLIVRDFMDVDFTRRPEPAEIVEALRALG
nr:peroxiredoxin-like family protein [uncultured Rhodopila sp.]